MGGQRSEQRRRIANGDGDEERVQATEVPGMASIAGRGKNVRRLDGRVSEAGQGRAARR